MKSPYSIAVLSGKGGVGKSNIALNLAYALNNAQRNVLLIDCDMGLANLDILLGVAPEHSLQEMLVNHLPIENCIISLKEVTEGTSDVAKLDLLPTESGTTSAAAMTSEDCGVMCEQVNDLAKEYEYTVLDIGAGISQSALSFGARVDMRIIIVTPEPTSLTDGYALMKVMSSNHGTTSFHIIVNQVESEKEGQQTYGRLAMVCENFLQFKPILLGFVQNDRLLAEAVIRQKPLMAYTPDAPAARDLTRVAKTIDRLRNELPEKSEGAKPLAESLLL